MRFRGIWDGRTTGRLVVLGLRDLNASGAVRSQNKSKIIPQILTSQISQ